MSWTATFKSWLENPTLPRFALRAVDPPFATASWLLASSYTKADAHDDQSGSPIIAAQGVRMTSPMRLDPSRWVCAGGEWQVTLAVSPDDTAHQWLYNLRRGQIFQVLAGPSTFTEAQLEPIASGVLYGVSTGSQQRGMVLTLRSVLSAFGGRITGQTSQIPLFYDIADPSTRRQTTVSSTYSSGDTTLEVASTTGFEDDAAHSGIRLLLVDPGGTPGTISASAFYLRATGTGTGPVRFTGVGTSDLYGTTRATASVGSPVYSVPFAYGHPIETALRFALSSGLGTNSVEDTLPMEWGLNISEALIDVADATAEILNAQPVSGTYELEILADTQEENPLAWMQAWLSPHAIFWTLRHGVLTLRAATTPGTSVTASGITITDDDIESFRIEAFDPARIPVRSMEYTDAAGLATPSTPITSMETLPVNDSVTIQCPHLWSNQVPVESGVYERVKYYYGTVGEIITLSCAGWRLAQLCAGDEVQVTSDHFLARPSGGSTAVSNRPCIVLSVHPNWTGRPGVVVVLMDLPDVPAED